MISKKYKVYYNAKAAWMTDSEFDGKSLIEIKNILQKKLEDTNFEDYETYWIMEYDLIRRQNKQHSFSKKDMQWHFRKSSPMSYITWMDAVEPFKTIAEWFLETFGYKSEQDKKMMEWIKQRDSNNEK